MKSIFKRSLLIVGIIFVLLVSYIGYYVHQLAEVGAGYMAKMMCSHVFISGMDPEKVAQEDVYDPLLEYFSYEVDQKK